MGKTLNQLLGENLDRLMRERGIGNKALAAKANLAPNTVANYRRGSDPAYTAKGKERSAKLSELEQLAGALGVDPLALLTDPHIQAERAKAAVQALLGAHVAPKGPSSSSADESRKRPARAA